MKAFLSINCDHMPNNAATQQGAALDLTPSTRFLLSKLVSGCSASELGRYAPKIRGRKTEMISSCGLDCSKCEGYLATQDNDDDKRVAVAKNWSELYNADIKAENINCDGCREKGRNFFYCSDMCEIRKCCIEKGLANCAACSLYACDKLKKFFEVAPEAKSALDSLRI